MNEKISTADIRPLFERIGYTIKNSDLLFHALCRTAFARENAIPLSSTMDYLAVLGDAVIEISVIQSLIEEGVTEKGEITRRKIAKVNMSVLRRLAEDIGLPDLVYWGKGERTMEIWTSGRVSAECLEALMGAVYLDGGMDAAQTVLKTIGFL